MASTVSHPPNRFATAYANLILKRPLQVLGVLILLLAVSLYGASKLTIETNQLDLISQDLREVKDVKRVIDMVGGAGYLIVALKSDDEKQLKAVADDLAAQFTADKKHVRFVTYKLPVEFIQQNMVLFVKTEDLAEVKTRVNAHLRDQLRRNNPFFFELEKTEPVPLELDDIVDRYTRVGKKSILDDYQISDDKQMLLVLVKPQWDSNELGKTNAYLEKLKTDLENYSRTNKHGVNLVEAYDRTGTGKQVVYGYTGSYKLSVDDSYSIERSLPTVTNVAFIAIALITMLFFRKWFPTVVVISGMVVGTVYTMGFTYLAVGSLNMVTSMLAGILMGFGVDYGIHFIFRTRLELGMGKPYDEAIRSAIVNAGRPAAVSAIVTAGSFFVLLISEFRGFSQLGLLAGAGVIIIGFTLFCWSPAILAAIGNRRPEAVKRLIGEMQPVHRDDGRGELRIPHPKLLLAGCTVLVAAVCAFAVPWTDYEPPKDHTPTMWERFKGGVRFDYNTRALLPEDQYSVKLNDEIGRRFRMSSDPVAVYSKDLADARSLYEELTPLDPVKYSTIDQVVSIYTFVPPADVAAANAKILEEWKAELSDIDVTALPADLKPKAELFQKVLDAKPYDVQSLPEIYASQFRHLSSTKPENHGYLTFIYPQVDLWDGKQMLAFADQVGVIKTADDKEFRAAGAPILFAKLARIVLQDGQLTLILTTLWILVMHFLDFRRPSLALASVIPLIVGLFMMLGILSMMNERLNFMNIVILPILLGFGVSHGLYLLHRFLEGTSPIVAFRSVGAAVASSTLTAIAGFAALFAASHNGLKSMGLVACLGLATTLVISFTVLAAVLQILHDRRVRNGTLPAAAAQASKPQEAA